MEAPRQTRRLARTLRQEMSLPEVLLWNAIKGGKLDGLHFRKQHPLGPYVLDFYCDDAKLCVEVDGASHSAAPATLAGSRISDEYLGCLRKIVANARSDFTPPPVVSLSQQCVGHARRNLLSIHLGVCPYHYTVV